MLNCPMQCCINVGKQLCIRLYIGDANLEKHLYKIIEIIINIPCTCSLKRALVNISHNIRTLAVK